MHTHSYCCNGLCYVLSLQAKKKEMARLNRELHQAQAELNQQKRLRDDLGPQHIKLKESISTLKRQVRRVYTRVYTIFGCRCCFWLSMLFSAYVDTLAFHVFSW